VTADFSIVQIADTVLTNSPLSFTGKDTKLEYFLMMLGEEW